MRRSGVQGRLVVLVLALAVALVSAPSSGASPGDVRVTNDDDGTTSYLRYDGSSDAVTADCSHGRRQQNEPSIAVDPHDPDVIVAGANDYCTTIHTNEVWTGYYRSTDGGATWANSLVPGYPGDSSPAGLASPTSGTCTAAGDPTQAFDNRGRLFYGFICFNRAKPINGGVFVARYLHDGADYDRTVLVKRGTPSGLFLAGLFQDKINLAVDQTGGPRSGYVYVAWSQYNGFAGNNAILFSRSTNHGRTFSRPVRPVPVARGTGSYTDLAVGPRGTVYLTFITYPTSASPTTKVWLVRSTNGGITWRRPVLVANIDLFDSSQFSGNGFSDCGDGPFACPSGLTYSRFTSNSAVAADAGGVHVVWSARNAAGQAKVYVRNSPGGVRFGPRRTLDRVARGHQWFPDIDTEGGTLYVVFYDSRNDPAYSPNLPPGDTAAGKNSGDVVWTFVATSVDGGRTWSESPVSTAGSNFGWETHGTRRVGFWGDYLYVSAVPGRTAVAWTDSRDLVPGNDPRETGADDDHDGFDVLQPCTYVPNDIDAPSYSSPTNDDPCLNQGGLDQNIYAASV